MPKLLGLDYGAKRVGVALSDESGALAFPRVVLENNPGLLGKIKEICRLENIGAVILGESLDQAGRPNLIMVEINKFKNLLEKEIALPVYFEPEIFTSTEAGRYQEKKSDASAAALILQRFLEKKKWK